VKKIIPFKYIFYIFIFSFILPISIGILLILLLENKSNFIIALLMFLFFCPILGIIIVIKNNEHILINLNSGDITCNILNNLDSWNWTKNIKSVKTINYTKDKLEINKIFKRKHMPNKLLIFQFNNQEIKSISMDLFTNKQVLEILNILDELKKVYIK